MENLKEFVLHVFNNRYTCKGYDPEKKVSDEDFRVIMEAARLSPSSMGYEPWQFVLLNNKEIKEKIRPYSWGAEKALDGASHFVLILARSNKDMRYDSEYIQYITKEIQKFPDDMISARREKFRNFQENDFKLLASERALFDWTCKQTYIPLANMLTTAAILGVDSTPIEGFNRDKVEEILISAGVYDPEHFRLSCMIAFGYTNRDHRPKTRRSIEEVWKVVD